MRNAISYGFLAPPSVFILVGLLGAVMTLMWRRAGVKVMLAATLCLYVMATPAFSSSLLVWLEAKIPKLTDFSSAQAIVVLGVDVSSSEERTNFRLGPQSLECLVFATDAYERLHLPTLVSGGRIAGSQLSLAAMMSAMLGRYFSVPVTWTEEQSRTTYENAVYTSWLLRKVDIKTIVLITQARDAPRAVWAFQRLGLRVLPWPAPRTSWTIDRVTDFLPSTKALDDSFYVLHELIGGFYYRIRYS